MNLHPHPVARRPLSPQRGLSLVSMMIAVLLGLVIVSGAISVMLSNKQTYQTSQNLAQLHDNARTTFELMARALREAGGNPCGTGFGAVNAVNQPASNNWWLNWEYGAIVGYGGSTEAPPVAFGTAALSRVSGTDAIIIRSGSQSQALTVVQHNPNSAQFKLSSTNHGLQDGDILMVCDSQGSAILQVSNASDTNVTIVHNIGSRVSPGNCTKFLGPPTTSGDCATNTPKTFQSGGFLSKLSSSFWYVGHNGRGGQCLYRYALNGNPTSLLLPDEIAEGVQDMKLHFLEEIDGVLATNYVAASAVTNWNAVVAVRIELELTSTGPQNSNFNRKVSHTVRLRNIRAAQ